MLEHYTPGYSANATSFMANRTAAKHGAFFQPYLRSGMQLLDCGCGPGSITLGLASLVAPAIATGLDQEASQVQLAQENAMQQGITNVKFRVGSVYQLPFADQTFDAIFSHAVIEHLQSPEQALREWWRVLKPGGIVGVRVPDWGGFLTYPGDPDLAAAIAYYKQLQEFNGGNPYVGRQLKALLRAAGFTDIRTSASYEHYIPLSTFTDYLAFRIEASQTVDQAIDRGWVDIDLLTRMSQAVRSWSQHPDAFFAQTWCEAVAYKKPEVGSEDR